MPEAPDRFAACAATVMTERGGFRSHDPLLDGPSTYGIGLGLLSVWIGGPADAAMLRGIEKEAAVGILRNMVWAPVGGTRFPAGVDLALFAYALEAGTVQALTDLQLALGVPASGSPDALTIAAAGRRDPHALAETLRAARATWHGRHGLPRPVSAIRRRSRSAVCTA